MEDEFVGMLLWDVWDMPNLLVLFPRPRAASPFEFTFRMVITRSELPGTVCPCIYLQRKEGKTRYLMDLFGSTTQIVCHILSRFGMPLCFLYPHNSSTSIPFSSATRCISAIKTRDSRLLHLPVFLCVIVLSSPQCRACEGAVTGRCFVCLDSFGSLVGGEGGNVSSSIFSRLGASFR